jgi:hypothetical protein
MPFGEDMKQSNLPLVFYGGLVILFAYAVKVKRRMEEAEVVRDAELYLKATRLQELILPEQQKIIDEITKGWNNEPYRPPIRRISLQEWLRQSRISISSP